MQSEYLVLVELKRSRAELDAVLLRLKLAGMPDADIEALRRTKKVRTSFHIAAPIDGVLTAFALKNGMNVTKSDAVAAVEGLDPLWVTVRCRSAMRRICLKRSLSSPLTPSPAAFGRLLRRQCCRRAKRLRVR